MKQETILFRIIVKIILGIGLFELLFRIFNGTIEREIGTSPAFWPLFGSGFGVFTKMVENWLAWIAIVALLIVLIEFLLNYLKNNLLKGESMPFVGKTPTEKEIKP